MSWVMTDDDKTCLEKAPRHLHAEIEVMRTKLLEHGKYRRKKRGKDLPEWKVSIGGARCALVLERWLRGLHHLPQRSQIHEIDWSNEFVELRDPRYAGLDTFDCSGMTDLVILAHEHCVRAEAVPSMNVHVLRLDARDCRSTVMYTRHPDLAALKKRIEEAEARITEFNNKH